MNDIYQQLMAALYGIWRRRWYALATTIAICTIGWIAVATIPNSYTSSARIFMDTESFLRSVMNDVTPANNLRSRLDIMRRTLISRPNLEKVIRRTDLYLIVDTDEEIEALIDDLENDITITDQGTNLFRVEYSSGFRELTNAQNAEMASRVVQNLLNIFVETNLGTDREEMTGTIRFIDQQISDARRALDDLERRRTEFEQRNLGVLSGETGFFQQMSNARKTLSETEAQLNEATLVRDELARQLDAVPQFIGVSGNFGPQVTPGVSSDMPERIALLQQQLDALKVRGYTDQHPDVVVAQTQLDKLRDEYRAEQEKLHQQAEDQGLDSSVATSTGQMPNPVYEQTKIKLIEAEANIASLTGRRKQQLAAVRGLDDQAKNMPLLEAEKTTLDRDYQIARKNYEDLLDRRKQALLFQDMEGAESNLKYRVVDPPTQPLEPSSPNRPLLLSLVLLGGLGAGIGLSFLLGQVRTTFLTVRSLRDGFAYPVLGAVSAVASEIDMLRAKREQRYFVFSCAIVLVAYGLFLGVELLQRPSL